ncbi:unnamed protein product [Discula destructiva]
MTRSTIFPAKHVRFEHHPDGFGIGTATPRLSWRYASQAEDDGDDDGDDGNAGHSSLNVPGQNWSQKAYIIDVQVLEPGARGQIRSKHRVEVASDNSLFVPWVGPALRSRERAYVHIVGHNSSSQLATEPADDNDDNQPVLLTAAASDPITADPDRPSRISRIGDWVQLEAALLHASDWKAKFITSPYPPPTGDVPHRPTIYRKVFAVDDKACSADAYSRLYMSSLGLYEACINGKRVGDHHMAPGWTSYHYRVQYQTYDVSRLLKPGKNVMTVEVAEGWYAGRLLWVPGLRNLYGDKPAFIAQLEMHQPESSVVQIVSDNSWTCHRSPRLSSSIYNGEVYDAREVVPNWDQADFDETTGSGWEKTRILDFDFDKTALVATDAPPVRITQVVKPVKVFTSPSGKTLVDFGQNLVGRLCIRGLQKPAGHRLVLRHAEVLEDGELGTRPLRGAEATDEYVFSGRRGSAAADDDKDNEMTWAPQFTFHGFRYAELNGWSPDDPVPPSADTLSALVIGSDLHRTGHFQCSHALVNKLHANVVWGMRGNFLSVPTDCPQRDERLGWTGDLQVFAPTASYLFSTAGFLTNWLHDLTLDQFAPDRPKPGVVPVVIPDVLHGRDDNSDSPRAIWDDAAVIVPWTVHRASGDTAVLRAQWASIDAHLHTGIQRGPDGLWDPSLFQFGDWLDPNAPPDDASLARTDGTLCADAYLVHVTDLAARCAVVIGDAAAARAYTAEREALKRAFAAKYVAPSGLVVGDSQTALALAICFDLLQDDDGGGGENKQVRAAGERLARLVRAAGRKVSTGFAGTPLVLHALTATGQTELAYEMLLQTECPGWLYPVTMGATTIWERWDAMLPDGRINPGSMTSFNHYALGSVADWLHTVVGGIEMLTAGWRAFRVRPVPGGGLSWAEARFEAPLGWIGCRWRVEGGRFTMRVEVPPNSRALMVLPGQSEEEGVWRGAGVHEMQCEVGMGDAMVE